METTAQFLDILHARLTVIERPETRILKWYRDTIPYFISFFGETHAETKTIRYLQKAYEASSAFKSPFELIEINKKHRQDAIDHMNDLIAKYATPIDDKGKVIEKQNDDMFVIAPEPKPTPAPVIPKKTPYLISKELWHNPVFLVGLSIVGTKLTDVIFDTKIWTSLFSFLRIRLIAELWFYIILVIITLILTSLFWKKKIKKRVDKEIKDVLDMLG